jgi:hypothetical protein
MDAQDALWPWKRCRRADRLEPRRAPARRLSSIEALPAVVTPSAARSKCIWTAARYALARMAQGRGAGRQGVYINRPFLYGLERHGWAGRDALPGYHPQ